jgi:hypothetical protein
MIGNPYPPDIILNDSSIMIFNFKFNSFKDYEYSNKSLIQSELHVTILKTLIWSGSKFLGYSSLYSRAMMSFGLIVDTSLYLTIWYISYHCALF